MRTETPRATITLLAALCVVLAGGALTTVAPAPSIEAPPSTSPLWDRSNLFSVTEEEELRQQLRTFARETGVEVGIACIESTAPLALEEYSFALANEWALGQRGLNNGLLILVAVEDRQFRIEVGTGLEWQISDSRAAEIVERMVPYFGRGEFRRGIEAGLERLAVWASSVPWEVGYDSLESLPSVTEAAIGRIVRFPGRFSSIDQRLALVRSNERRVRLLLPPHWAGLPDRPRGGDVATIYGRITELDPLTLQALGFTRP
jgi:uncharacterized membrane protein YgcG